MSEEYICNPRRVVNFQCDTSAFIKAFKKLCDNLEHTNAERVHKCANEGYKLSLDGQLVLPGFEQIMLQLRWAPFGVELVK